MTTMKKCLAWILCSSVSLWAVAEDAPPDSLPGIPEVPSRSNQEGDLNTNTQNSTVSSYNSSKTYNGAGSSGMPVNSTIAPSLMSGAGPETCLQSTTGAMQLVTFGLSAGRYVEDPGCTRRRDAMTLNNMGLRLAAVSLMCQNKAVFRAMLQASTPCPIVVRGKIVIGRRAYLTISEAPTLYIDDYDEYKDTYDAILGTKDDASEVGDDGTLSERFRSSAKPGN